MRRILQQPINQKIVPAINPTEYENKINDIFKLYNLNYDKVLEHYFNILNHLKENDSYYTFKYDNILTESAIKEIFNNIRINTYLHCDSCDEEYIILNSVIKDFLYSFLNLTYQDLKKQTKNLIKQSSN